MSNPSEYEQPSRIGDKYYYDFTIDTSDSDDGVHRNNTIVSHACYLMWKNGIVDKGRLADLWYHSLLLGYDKNSTFESVRMNVSIAAIIMGMSLNEMEIINNAFDAVGIEKIEATNISEIDISGIDVFASDCFRVECRWEDNERNLMVNLIGPTTTGGDYIISYGRVMDSQPVKTVNIDIKKIKSYEIGGRNDCKPIDGIHTFYLNEYGGLENVSSSKACVKVYPIGSSKPLYVFNVPTNQLGKHWKVFSYDSIKNEIIPINNVLDTME